MDEQAYYKLNKSFQIRYEWDKGLIPSGYALIQIRLEPNDIENHMFHFDVASDKIWQIRETEYVQKQEPENLKKMIDSFMENILKGIRHGAERALSQTLDKKVKDVTLIVEQVVVDPVYSTEKSFFFATKIALEKLFKEIIEAKGIEVINPIKIGN